MPATAATHFHPRSRHCHPHPHPCNRHHGGRTSTSGNQPHDLQGKLKTLGVALRPAQAQDLLEASLVEGQEVLQPAAIGHCVPSTAAASGTRMQEIDCNHSGEGSCRVHNQGPVVAAFACWRRFPGCGQPGVPNEDTRGPAATRGGWWWPFSSWPLWWTDEVPSGAPTSPAVWPALPRPISG